MGHYHFEEHTADEKFIVKADDINDAFTTTTKAFYSILLDNQTITDFSHTRDLRITARKIESLLYDFINELIYYYDAEDLLLPQVNHMLISKRGSKGYVLEAVLAGTVHYDYPLETEIKNATYSEMCVKQDETGAVTMTVVVDI
ncbi:MAG: archease [Nanobdellota archaeon]